MLARKTEKLEEKFESALKDGTRLSGFVTAKENPPPRDCAHCRWFANGCTHPVVRIDPELRNRLQANGNVKVDGDDCCDSYQAKQKGQGS